MCHCFILAKIRRPLDNAQLMVPALNPGTANPETLTRSPTTVSRELGQELEGTIMGLRIHGSRGAGAGAGSLHLKSEIINISGRPHLQPLLCRAKVRDKGA